MVINSWPTWSRVRIAALLAVSFLLAGCTQGTPDRDGFVASCPSWVKLPYNGQIIEGNLQWTNMSSSPNDLTRTDFMPPQYNQSSRQWKAGNGVGDGNLRSYAGHPLDQVVFNFHQRTKGAGEPGRLLYVQDGTLTARFYASEEGFVGDPVQVYDEKIGPSSAKHEWTFGVNPQTNWAIHNVTLRIDLAGADEPPAPMGIFVEWQLLPDRDRNRDTPSVAVMHYGPEFWYRTCSKDGTRH